MKEQLQHKIDFKTKPLRSLGKLEEVALKIGMIQNTLTPELKNPTHLVFAADHGLADEGVSPYPKEVTYQMVMNFLNGGAAINIFCRQNDIKLKVIDAGVDFDFPAESNLIHEKIARGSKNILKEPAMSMETCQQAMDKGKEILNAEFDKACNIISFGEMGIGNTSAAALLLNKFTGLAIEECTGRGTGHNDAGLKKKISILKEASTKHQVNSPKEILAAYGGLEIAMMCGAMLQAKENNMTILVDGFIVTSALLVAYEMDKSILDNCIFCHHSQEKAHKHMLAHMGVEALVNLNMRLGEGTGAAVVYPIIKSAVLFLNEMASFEDAGVTNKD
ncbi:MAG: nicotinate-nucleotide--dimethylbenzimidazole phosphoribosyltransferase [Salinivirgaceae bacterium]|nr:nicotinate-nucleotide--dimethylbenzimidazole phosphoribosyltransferase [Salinivirgaceae bacterium]